MKTRNSTKSKLLSSVIALVLCVSMLIGATFAWFTDTASTGVNKIQAGNLDIALEMKDNRGNWVNAEGKTLQFKVGGSIPAEGTQILWEPGCTYELPELRIINKGNLALKYKIVITGIQGDAELNRVIDWTINDANLSADHPLAPGAFDTLTIKGHMQESAGNEYQGLTIDGIGITVYATQMEAEFDSFNNSYDHDADYIERHATIMGDDGKTITLEKGKTYTVGNATVDVAANGDIKYTNTNTNTGTAQTVTIQTDGGNLTVNAPNDTVYHYGTAGLIDIIKVASNSYHEFGDVGVLSIAQGRVVVENGDNIGIIQVKANNAESNPVVIAVPQNVVLDTKIEKASGVGNVNLKVINSNGADTTITTTNGTTNETIPVELKKVLVSQGQNGTIGVAKDYVARIGNNFYESISAAVAAAQSGDTVTLLKDVAYATNGNGLFNITKSITLDGNGHKITGYGNRGGNNTTLAINNSGTDKVSVELKNLTIENAGTNGRAVETRGNIESLKITNCKFNCTDSGNTQVLTIGGSQSSAANVTINQSALSAGKAGYPIITFNPIKLKIENESVLSGFCGIYFKGVSGSEGSHGSTVTAENSEFDCPNVHSGEGSNDFGVFSLEDDNINITVTNCKINAQAQGTARQAILMTSSYAHRTNNGFSITIAGDSFVNGNLLSMSDKWNNGYTYSITGGTFTVGSEAALNTLLDSIAADASNVTINLASDISLAKPIQVSKNVTINGQNHTITSGVFDSFKVTGTVNFALKNLTIESQYRHTVDGVEATTLEGSKLSFENVTINNAEKAILFSACKETAVSIKGCTLSSLYPFNVSGGTITSFTVEDSQLNGWTSFNKLANDGVFQFKNCSFGEKFGYATLKPYGDTTFEGCTISEEFFEGLESGIASGTVTPITVNFNKCFVKASNGTTQALTVDLLKKTFNYDITSGSSSGDSTINSQFWYVDGEQIAFATSAG